MKGKKFDAAEKHFEKKRMQYEKQIKSLNEQLDNAHRNTDYFRKLYEFAERENEELKNWVERLLEYTHLSKDDIRQACDKDKKMAKAAQWLETYTNFMR
jgi:hypothetical protein